MSFTLAAALVKVQMGVDRSSIARAKAEAKAAADTMDGEATITLTVEQAAAKAAIEQLRKNAASLTNREYALVLHTQATQAKKELDEAYKKIGLVQNNDELEIAVRAKDTATARLNAIQGEIAQVERSDPEVLVSADTSKLKPALDKAEKTVEASARDMGATLGRWFTAGAVVAQINGAIQAAANLEQSIGGSTATFGEWASIIDDAATTAANSMGLSENAARTLTSQIGGLLKGFGFTAEEAANTSVKLAQLGADLAATFGGNPEEAVQALGASLRGEFDPLERFGVSLNQTQINLRAVELGLASSTSNVDQNARAQAALSLIMERTVDSQGQFAREAETASGKQARLTAEYENARAKLGEQLLPIYSQAVEIASQLVDVFSSLPGPVQGGIVAMLGIAAVAGPVRDVSKAFTGLSGVIGKLSGPTQAGMLGLGVAVGIAVLALQSLDDKQKVTQERTQETSDALNSQADALLRLASSSVEAETETGAMQVVLAGLSDALTKSGPEGEKLTQALGALSFQAQDAAGIITGLRSDPVAALQYLARGADVASEHVDILARAVASTDANGRDLQAVIRNELITALGLSSDEADRLAEQLLPVAQNMEQVQDAAENNNVDVLARNFLNLMVASGPAGERLVEAAEAETELSRAGEGAIDVMAEFIRQFAMQDQATQDAVTGNNAAAESATNLATEIEGIGDKARGARTEINEATKETSFFGAELPVVGKAAARFGLDAAEAAEGAKKLGTGVDDAGEAAANAAGPIDQLVDVTSDLTTELDDAESAYNDLVNAINRVLDPGDKLRAATRAVFDQMEKLNESLGENGAGLNETATDFDVNTEAGRANQEQMEATRDSILEHGAAMIGNGRSARDAAADIAYNTGQLREQLLAAGLTTDEVDKLLRTYGLMPDQVTTYISVAGEQEAKRKLDEHKTLISQLPTSSQLYIQALIDRGAWNLVNSQLNLLTAPRSALIQSTSGGGNRNTGPRPGLARGGVVDEPFFGWVGEDDTEVVLPKSRSRIAEILGDPRAAEIAGMARDVLGGGDNSSSTYSPSLQVSIGSIGSARDVPEALDAVDGWWWEFSQTKAHS